MKQRRKSLVGCILACCLAISMFPRVHAATKTSAAGVVTTQSTGLNVREEPSSTSKRRTTLPKGSYITLLNKRGDWWYVEYAQGQYGYCAAQYITEEANSVVGFVNTQQTGLNVRKGPGTRYSVDAVLAKGTIFVILSETNGWQRILYNGTKTGYVKNDYVQVLTPTPTSPSTPTPTPTPDSAPTKNYQPIALSVPYASQLDDRWGWYPLGTQGGNIRTIGCLVTCISMMESYRTGTVITPNQQAAGLSFTPGGAMYWPGHYERSYCAGSAAYMVKIYEILQSGRPVVIGNKTAAGGQHWVVVTGYTGSGNTLSLDKFTINDPGGNGRTNLAQHVAAYPIYYCIAYYKA